MPTPIIELQRRLALVGAIRAGGEKQPNKPGAKLESFRLTSPRRSLVEQAAELYGGDVSQWQSPVGVEWQVYTQAEELPVLVMPGYSLRQSYELWEGATKRLRLCDGVDEELSGTPCMCAQEGVDRCDIYTRLVVALPELDTALGWRLITKGANAAHELPTMLALVEARSGGASFVPARLRIDSRRGVKDGQVVRYVVPTLDMGMGYAQLAGAQQVPALPAAPPVEQPRRYETATPRTHDVEQALETVASPRSPLSGNLPELPEPDIEDAPAPFAPNEDDPLVAASTPPETAPEEGTKAVTAPQKKKLNVLVGKLREGGHITTDGLYKAIATLRKCGGLELAMTVGGYDDEHQLHWAPLRDALTRPEAVQLIDWLEIKQSRVVASTGESADSPAPEQEVLT